MTEQSIDPGPVPAVVEPEPEPVEATMVVSALLGQQIGVTANWRHTGLVGLTLRIRDSELTVALAEFEVDGLCQMLAAACPLELVPAGSAEYTREPEPGAQGSGRPWAGARFDNHDDMEDGR